MSRSCAGTDGSSQALQSERLKTTPSTVAIAWTMSQPAITSAIASATSVEQLDELLKATELTLDAESLAQLQAASAV